ncbi:hypothetical protein TSTA_029950 [Talaromyces stipitatus ATCC 10500]|uniref:Uncharacterized protein n=1 Tax=Talaromyces stipitatus (strain ATCC 10500 / CBS 375.48 / QM 6759 / NRRL 1006) TaxID=441959 RepID=B8M5B8_TALSN|nr:uncharacterized protein TSTA_029950 [Talaromyces stipitatus ATCC 10500]EED19724.1 hypothetical protein TSTA_029950 [Talaromyces stipitatus ATCC 10500]
MSEKVEIAKPPPVVAEVVNQDAISSKENSPHPVRPKKALQSTPLLFLHTVGSIALALVLVYAVDGYNAGDDSTPRYVDGKLLLRSSDVTTLVSAALVLIKFFTTSWAAIATWRGLTSKQVSFMTRYKLLPWMRLPFGRPRGRRSWAVALSLLCSFPQPFIAPLLSGAVNWNPSFAAGPQTAAVSVNWTNPTASGSYWDQYTKFDYPIKRTDVLREALGYANIAWSDTTTVSANGTSLRGNGCRHVVNFDGLPENSTLTNFVVPCIKVQNIAWAMSAAEVPNAVFAQATTNGWQLSVLNDSLVRYTNPGHAVLFDVNNLWYNKDIWTTSLPTANKVTGANSLTLIIANQYSDCQNLTANQFGNVNSFPQFKTSWALGSCYLFANVTIEAGVTTSKLSKYVSPRVIEDQTPLDDTTIDPNTWSQEAVWLLPDMMTSLSQMNSTLLPTWNNLDLYVESLIRQSYLGAWDSFHNNWDTDGTISLAIPQQARVRAEVSHARVYSWLAISLLETVSGIFLVYLLLNPGLLQEPDLPGEIISEQIRDAKASGKKIMDSLSDLSFF